MKLWQFLVFSSFLATVHLNPVQISPRADDEEYRLPADIIETINYNLELKLEKDVFETNSFDGVLTLTFKALKEADQIKIHASRLTFSVAKLTKTNDNDEEDLDLDVLNNPDTNTEIITIPLTKPLVAEEEYQFYFVYTAVLRTEDMYGLYKSSYTKEDGRTVYLATTQFESTYARRVFPSFDEPSYKATFDIKITHPSSLNARSNTKGVAVTDQQGETTVTTFPTTPITPTYLVAFIISEFTCTTGDPIEENVIPQDVCSRPQTADIRALAVEKSPPIMQALEEITGVKYSFSGIGKMDQYAIPDFAAGAMENWGLVTYRETGLLWDPQESSNTNKQSIENVIAHEFTHQWFGNLVTMDWWSDTWLNEGFARLYQYLATSKVESDWELEKQFVVSQLQSIFVSDTTGTQALSSPAYTQSQISGKFSSISYSKGASVIRMMLYFIGEEAYKRGITEYLTKNAFKNTKPEHLWEALSPETKTLPEGVSLVTAMNSWIYSPGYPILQVSLNGNSVTISQKRFESSTQATPSATKWYVPITYTKSTDANKFANTAVQEWLLPTEDLTLTDVLSGDNDWIILNNQQIGYYRVSYDDELWSRIEVALRDQDFSGISDVNRAQLVDDFNNLARYGWKSYSQLLDLLVFLREDTSYFPWYAAFTAFNNMLARIRSDELQKAFSEYILILIDKLYNSLPFKEPNDDNQIYTLNRALAINWACKLGHEGCLADAAEAFKALRENETPVDKNLRSVVYCNALRHSTDARGDWDLLWKKYTTTFLAAEQSIILTALGCVKDSAILKEYLSKSITPDAGIRAQDASSVFSAVYSGNPEGVDVAFEFFLENTDAILDYYTSMSSINNLLVGIAGRFTKQEQLDKLKTYLETPNLAESVVSAGSNAVRSAEANLALIDAFEEEMNLYFNKDEPTTEETTTEETTTEESTTEESTTEESTTEESTTEESTTEESTTEESTTEESTTEDSTGATPDPGSNGVVYKLSTALLLLILTVKLL